MTPCWGEPMALTDEQIQRIGQKRFDSICAKYLHAHKVSRLNWVNTCGDILMIAVPILAGAIRYLEKGTAYSFYIEYTYEPLMAALLFVGVRLTVADNSATIRTVSTLTRTIWPTIRTMYSSSSVLFGSDVMPLCLSSFTWYWSMTHSRALRFPRRYSNAWGGILARLKDSLILSVVLSLSSF